MSEQSDDAEATTDDMQGADDDAQKGEPGGRGCLLGCLGVLALVVVSIAVSCISLGGDSDPAEPTEYEARSVCEDWVRDRLKAPATAEFTDGATTGTAVGGFTITGAVDAENSFGALVRNEWTCEIRYVSDADEWRGSATVS